MADETPFGEPAASGSDADAAAGALATPPPLPRAPDPGIGVGPGMRGALGQPEPAPKFTRPPFLDVGAAAIRENNWMVGGLTAVRSQSPDLEHDPNWDAQKIIRGTKYAQYGDSFIGDINESVTRSKMSRIDAIEKDRETLENGGLAGRVIGTAAGFVDPILAVPIFGEAAKIGEVGWLAARTANAARFGVTGAIQGGVSEAAQIASDPTRTWKEAPGTIAASAIMMGVLGAAFGHLAPHERAQVAADLDANRPRIAVDPETGQYEPASQIGSVQPTASFGQLGTYGDDRTVLARMSAPDIQGNLGADIPGTHVSTFLRNGEEVQGIPAYHGTPHEFDRFDLGKIGTGEGAQVFGHGLYFADRRGIAESYRDRLTPSHDPGTPDALAASVLQADSIQGDRAAAIRDIESRIAANDKTDPQYVTPGWRDRATAAIDLLRDPTWKEQPEGHLYTVRIARDPEHFLQWEYPLYDQSPHVLAALEKKFPEIMRDLPDGLNTTGRDLYKAIGESLRPKEGRLSKLIGLAYDPGSGKPDLSPRAVPSALHEADIPGIRYADASSRTGAENVTHNYVVFNDRDIHITHKNDVPVSKPQPLPDFLKAEARANFRGEMKAASVTSKAASVTSKDFSTELTQRAHDLINRGVRLDHAGAFEQAAIERALGRKADEVQGRAAPADGAGLEAARGGGVRPGEEEGLAGAGTGLRDAGEAGGEQGGAGLARSVGAAAADERDLVPINFGLNQLGWFSRAVLDRFSPNLRIFTGLSTVAKRAMADLVETAIRFTQHAGGIPTALRAPLESIIRVEKNSYMAIVHDIQKREWLEHRWEGNTPGVATRAGAAFADLRGRTPEGKMSYAQFKEAVSDAMNNADVHPEPNVQKAAQELRAKVLDPVKEFAQRTRDTDGNALLGENLNAPKGAKSFFPHLWNKIKVDAQRPRLKQIFSDWLEQQQVEKAETQARIRTLKERLDASAEKEAEHLNKAKQLPEASKPRADIEYEARLEREKQDRIREAIETELKDWEGKSSKAARAAIEKRDTAGTKGKEGGRSVAADYDVDRAVRKILGSDRSLSREDLEARADEWIDRIRSSPDGRIPYDMHSANPAGGYFGRDDMRGSLNNRETAIPYDLIKDFLHRDTEMVIGAHLRTVLPDTHLVDRFGDVNLQDVMRRIQEEYASKIGPKTSETDARRIMQARDSDIKDIAAMRDRIRGTYGWTPMNKVDQIIRTAHNVSTIQSLGTSVINRFNDMGAQAVFRYGFMHTFSDLWMPLFQAMVFNPEVLKIGKEEAKAMGIGIDGMLGHMRHNITDIADMHQPGNIFSRGAAFGADRSMILNGHGPWTDWIKAANWVAAQSNFGKVAKRIADGTASARDLSTMADANIDRHMAARISAMYEKHHTEVNGVKIGHAGEWEDRQARDAFAHALTREVNINVITAGHGDKPLFMSRPLGALIGQFKGFTAGTHEKILISNLQQRDGRTLQGVTASVAMGMLSYRMYTLASGQQASDRPQDWIKEGIHRSAITGWLTEANSTLAKFTAGKADIYRTIGADRPISRRQENSALSDLLGPTYSMVEGAAGIVGHTLGGHASAQDISAARRLIAPMQNEAGLRILYDHVEDAVANSFGITPKNRDSHLYH